MRVIASFGLILLLSSCSDAPTETKVKEPEKPPAPITGQRAFQLTYPAARGWAGDSLPLHIRSVNLADPPSEAGKTGAWEITYVSASLQGARVYSWSAVEDPPLHKGIFGAKAQSWSGSGSSQEKPFAASVFKIDSPTALETATTAAKSYLEKPGTKPPVNFILEFTPRFPNPVWRVMWGATAGLAAYTVFVDAATGQVVGKN